MLLLRIQQLRMLALWILMPYELIASPVFGMKRYERSTANAQNNWGVPSVVPLPTYYYQPMPRPQNYQPVSYYDSMNLYAPEYDDYYYPQDSMAYPLYYPAMSRSASSNYDMYQPIIPYYYSPNPYVYYDHSDPMNSLQEEVLQEEREQREEALPVGQETWYDHDGVVNQDDSIDSINEAFMKNLMLYNKAMSQPNYVYGKVQPAEAYNQHYSEIDDWNSKPSDDKEEYELKMLNEDEKSQDAAKERLQMFRNNNRNQKTSRYNPNNSESWLNHGNKRQEIKKSRKTQNGNQISSSTVPPLTTETALRGFNGGQKEVVMMRPATPVRRPFSEPVMKILAQQGGPERKRTPSVYDTIKHMLEMEKNLEKSYQSENNYYRSPMRKRYVSTEENLVDELSGLKKTA